MGVFGSMKKIIPLLIASLACSSSCFAVQKSQAKSSHVAQKRLTEQERNKIWTEIHACVYFSENHFRRANAIANRIAVIEVRLIIKDASSGAIAGLAATKTAYGAAVLSFVKSVEGIIERRANHVDRAIKEVQIAYRFAIKADKLQEKLWRDQ